MLRTNRGLLKFILLSLITFGIYGIVVWCCVVEDLNRVASRRDGKQTMHFLLMALVLSPITFGIYGLVWCHNFSKRVGEELAARDIAYSFSAGTFWGWHFLGSLIIIGPFVYMYKLFKAMNMINASYNQEHA